MLLLNKKISI